MTEYQLTTMMHDHFMKMDHELHRYKLHGGMIDFVSGEFLLREEVDNRNINPLPRFRRNNGCLSACNCFKRVM